MYASVCTCVVSVYDVRTDGQMKQWTNGRADGRTNARTNKRASDQADIGQGANGTKKQTKIMAHRSIGSNPNVDHVLDMTGAHIFLVFRTLRGQAKGLANGWSVERTN